MSRPRPPRADTVACARTGVVGAPPSLTATSTASSPTAQATCTFAPGSGLACRIALLSNSLTTRTASPTAASKIPAALRSAASRWRATATLAGAQGRSTVPAALTSSRQPVGRLGQRVDPLRRRCPSERDRNRSLSRDLRSHPAGLRWPARGSARAGPPSARPAHPRTGQPESGPVGTARCARLEQQRRRPAR